jgi:ABC-type polysaccharide/polyol phosphate export permease
VLALATLQVGVLLGVAVLRGADFHARASGVAWFAGAALLFTALMYALAEVLASRMPNQEEYIAATPVVAILPWFFAGALFPIAAMPAVLTAFAKVLPLTHALALMRYGLVDPHATGLHDIWGAGDATTQAVLSFVVVAIYALALGALAVRAFTRSAVT